MSAKDTTLEIEHDDPKFRTTPLQQAAASCTGAIITSLMGKFVQIQIYMDYFELS